MKTITNKAKEILTKYDKQIATGVGLAIIALTVAGLCYGHKKNLIHAAEGERILRILQEHLL